MGILARLEASACNDDQPFFCAAVRGWEGASGVALAEGEHVALGLTLGIEEATGEPPAFDDLAVSVFAWRRHADRAVGRIVELTPTSDEEKLETAEARKRLVEVLRGETAVASIPPGLARDLPPFAAAARYPPGYPHPRTWPGSGG